MSEVSSHVLNATTFPLTENHCWGRILLNHLCNKERVICQLASKASLPRYSLRTVSQSEDPCALVYHGLKCIILHGCDASHSRQKVQKINKTISKQNQKQTKPNISISSSGKLKKKKKKQLL